jgi:hypothetical protein
MMGNEIHIMVRTCYGLSLAEDDLRCSFLPTGTRVHGKLLPKQALSDSLLVFAGR